MTLISSREFVSNQKRYFDLALNEDVVIKRGSNRFHLMFVPAEKQYHEQPYFEKRVEGKCQDWYGITDAEDDEEGIYSGDELVENALNALREYHESQILKNGAKNSQ